MDRTRISELYRDAESFGGKSITVCGWVRSVRDSKALGFIDLNDGSCFKGLQVVFEADKVENFEEITKYNVGAAVCVTGEVLLTPKARQPFEVHAAEIKTGGCLCPRLSAPEKAPQC